MPFPRTSRVSCELGEEAAGVGVVSAMTCMVKTESPVLTSSCRELLSR